MQLAFTCRLATVALGGRVPPIAAVDGVDDTASPADVYEGLGGESSGFGSGGSGNDGGSGRVDGGGAAGGDRAAPVLAFEALRLPSDATSASALVDAVLPGAFCRPFWTKSLLHSAMLVRLAAANALTLLLPLLKASLTDRLAALAAAAPSLSLIHI